LFKAISYDPPFGIIVIIIKYPGFFVHDVRINLQFYCKPISGQDKLLEEMLKLSEEHTGIDLRKKFGAKQ